MRSVSYDGQKYYFLLLKQDSYVLDFQKKKVSTEKCKSLGFKSILEFCDFLDKLKNNLEKSLPVYHDEQSIAELISQNLVTLEGLPISLGLTKSLLKGQNYKIVKQKDLTETLRLLNALRQKNDLMFMQIKLDLKVKLNNAPVTIKKYLKAPYGEIQKDCVFVSPILVQEVLKNLY